MTMTWQIAIRDLRSWVESYVQTRLGALVEFTRVAASTATGEKDAVEVGGGDQRMQRPVRRVEPWGVRGRPPAGVFAAIVKAIAGASNGLLVGISSTRYGSQALEAGETEIYCSASGTRIFLDKTGTIHIDAASGQDVILNGGTLQVARETDALDVGTLVATAGPYPVLFTYTPGAYPPPGTPQSGASISLAGIVAKGTGAAHTKG